MSETIRKMFREILDRAPTAEDYRRIDKLRNVLPDRLRDDASFLADVILRAEHIRSLAEVLNDVLDRATSCVEKRVAHGIDAKIKEAALDAVRRIADKLPNDPVNLLRRYGYFAIGCTVTAFALGLLTAWIVVSGYPDSRAAAAAHEAQGKAGITLGHCLNEAHDIAKRGRRRSANALELANINERIAVQLCAARYLQATAAPT